MGGVLGLTAFLELDNPLNRMPGRTLYQIFDANWVNEVPCPINVSGGSHASALTFGRIAGMNAANEV